MDRREAIAAIASVAGAGATCKAVEKNPGEAKVLFYVLKMPETYEIPDPAWCERMVANLQGVIGNVPIVVLPFGYDMLKCTELPELSTATRSWWRKALGL